MVSDPIGVAHAFVGAINHHDVDAIAGLMSEDHVFFDSDGSTVHGKQRMKDGWTGYFRMFPDYTITVEETYSRGFVVVMLGLAEGTYATGGALASENHWRVPAAWRATIRGGTALEWRVYVNVEPIREIVARCKQ